MQAQSVHKRNKTATIIWREAFDRYVELEELQEWRKVFYYIFISCEVIFFSDH